MAIHRNPLAAAEELEVHPGFILGALAGLRLVEVLGLKWASVDFYARRLRIHEQVGSSTTKTGAERFVDEAEPLANVLRDKLAGLPAHFTPHSLRHTFCSVAHLERRIARLRSAAGRTRLRRDDGLRVRELVRR